MRPPGDRPRVGTASLARSLHRGLGLVVRELRAVVRELRTAGLLTVPRFARTSSFRLTLLYAGLFSVSAALLFGLVYWIATSYVAGQIDSAVATEIAEERADAGGTLAGLETVIAAQSRRASPGAYYLLQDAHGRVLAGNLPPMAPKMGTREWTLPDGGIARGRGLAAPQGGYVLVGLAARDLSELRDAISYAFLWVVAGTLVLALIGGSVMSFSALGRVEAISRASRRIVAGDLDQRIALRGTNDEFDHLAASLNAMLDRMQTLMEGMRQVSSDIAHDLRTPVSRLRQRIELALLQANTAEELRAALETSLGDVDSILETFGALLRIARLESRADPPLLDPIDLGLVAEEVTQAYCAVAEEQGQHLACERTGPVSVRGSRELLTQMFANLIENALRHSPPGTTVRVTAANEDGTAVARVCDNGPGIPAASRAAVFRPFFRLEASRTTPGTGLGLSLVAAIAAIHGARVTLSDNEPGVCAGIRFAPGQFTAPEPDPPWLTFAAALLARWLPQPHAARVECALRTARIHLQSVLRRLREG
jgi:signal transduction histidine kinase